MIPVRITHRPNISKTKLIRSPSNSIILNTVPNTSPSESFLNCGLWNVRSITNKSFIVNTFITSHNLDFMFLVETWQNTDVHLIEACPPDYSFWNCCRASEKTGGGLAIIYRTGRKCSPTSVGSFSSFELFSFSTSHPLSFFV